MANAAVINGAPALVNGATTMALPYRKASTSVNAPIAFRIWMPAAIQGPSSPRLIGRPKSVMAHATGTSSSAPTVM